MGSAVAKGAKISLTEAAVRGMLVGVVEGRGAVVGRERARARASGVMQHVVMMGCRAERSFSQCPKSGLQKHKDSTEGSAAASETRLWSGGERTKGAARELPKPIRRVVGLRNVQSGNTCEYNS